MCGITGAVWSDSRLAVDAETLRRMTDVLRHRGPDDRGAYFGTHLGDALGVALGFRRLSIIDLEGGRQPLANEDESIRVVLNGEVYNYAELRRGLESAGHRFRTRSDTETIVHLYEDEGVGCLSRLNGMFALAIWDARRSRLVLARDRLGKKPLVYRHEPGRLAFASELKSLLEIPGPRPPLDRHALDAYLTYQYVPHPLGIYSGIRKLPPAHYAVYSEDRVEISRYWSPDFDHEEPMEEREACARLVDLLESSIALRMRADVPLGAFLSGGIDSSLVVALMGRAASGPIRTFSIGFPVAEYDETPFAREVARHVGTRHEEFEVRPDAVGILPELVWNFDEPFADSSAIPTWYLSRMTSEHVKVALSGDGGDELFLGYPRYKAMYLASVIDRAGPIKACMANGIWSRMPAPGRQKSRIRQWKRFSESLGLAPLRRYANWISIFRESLRADLYTDAMRETVAGSDPVAFLEPYWNAVSHRDPVSAVALVDLQTYLACDLMTKVDIASMAHGLECRQPFLDYRLVEFASGLPRRLKWRVGGMTKRLLRRAFGKLVPESVWTRPKMGFGVPLDHWFRGELGRPFREIVFDRSASCGTLWRRSAVERLLAEHESGRFDHASRLWALLVFESWRSRWNVPV